MNGPASPSRNVCPAKQAPLLYALSLIVVFLALAALYENWSIPVAVILVVPLGILGALLAATLRGLPNDVFFKVGLLTIVGLSAKNAILIIEFAKDLQAQGKGLVEATLEAAHLRLRPILMTSLAFILGVMPLALSTGAGSASRHDIGTGVAGGMVSATVLAVFLVPVFFVVIRRMFKTQKPSHTLLAPKPAGPGRCQRKQQYRQSHEQTSFAHHCLVHPGFGRLHARAEISPSGGGDFANLAHGCRGNRKSRPTPIPAADIGWREFFRDPRLQQLIELALTNNPDLRVAVLNVEQSRALYRVQRNALVPTVDINANGSRQRIAYRLRRQRRAGDLQPIQCRTSASPPMNWTFSAACAASKSRRWKPILPREEARKSAQIALVAEVGAAYLTERELTEQLAVARQTLKSARSVL